MIKKSLLLTAAILIISVITVCCAKRADKTGTLTDSRDGTTYKTVKIGNQWWMGENLRFESKSGYSWNEEMPQYKKMFGCYYSFDVAKTVCPAGWHLPSDKEWLALANSLGGVYLAGGKLKSKELWLAPNTGATDETGFSGLPAGWMFYDTFVMTGELCYFWSSTEFEPGIGSYWLLGNDAPVLRPSDEGFEKKIGARMIVRCIKDN